MQPRTFRAPRGVESFKTITIREVTGADELTAADIMQDYKSSTGKDGNVTMALVMLSITHVDGKPVNGKEGHFAAFNKWPSRDRGAASRFHMVLNGYDEDDMGKALAEGTMATPPQSAPDTPPPSGG